MIDLFVVSSSEELSSQFLDHVDTTFFSVTELESVAAVHSALRALGADAASAAVVLVQDTAPQGSALRDIAVLQQLSPAPTLFALESTHGDSVPALVAIGVQDVVPLDSLSVHRLRDVVVASVVRDRTLRDLRRQRNRALVKRDVVASIAGAGTRLEILEILLDGLVALDAIGARCWEVGDEALVLVSERGVVVPAVSSGIRPIHDDDLIASCVRGGRYQWVSFPGDNSTSRVRGVMPLNSNGPGTVTDVVELVLDTLPSEEDAFRLEQLGAQVSEALRRARLQVEQSQDRQADRRLMGSISHDLRSPLNTIMLATDMLREEGVDPDQLELVDMIDRAAASATRLTQDLLTFTRIAQNGLAIDHARIDLFDLLSRAVGSAQIRAADDRRIVLDLPGGEAIAEVDEARIEQAVCNLLSNALTYSPPASSIQVRGSVDDHAVYIDIENHGADIDLSGIADLFMPGRRMSAVAEKGSLGLGLFIVDRIMEAHGGRVWLETFAADGVRFSLQIPRRRMHGDTATIDLRDHHLYVPQRAAPGATREDVKAMRTLLSSFRTRSPGHFLDVWLAARGRDSMPHPLSLDRRRMLPLLPDIAHARVARDSRGELLFGWTQTGPRLERMMHGTLSGEQLTGGDTDWPSLQFSAYSRCVEQGGPVYDYVRQRGVRPFTFERLILPLSRDGGRSVTEVLALVVFSDNPDNPDTCGKSEESRR